MNLNVRGYFLLSQQIARLSMLERKHGRIINLSSIAGLAGNLPGIHRLPTTPPRARCSISPAHWRASRGVYGITVNTHLPWLFKTKMATVLIETIGEEEMKSHAPLRVWATMKTSRA